MRYVRNVIVTLILALCIAAVMQGQGGLTANAGADRNDALVGTAIALNGTGSTGAVTFAWTFVSRPSGSSAVLTSPGTATPTFTPDRGGSYLVRLTVGNGLTTATDTVKITTINREPIANAGPDLSATIGKSLALDGTASNDPDNDKLTYAWTIVDAPPASARALSGAASSKAKLVLDRPGTYVAELTVRDGQLWSDADQVTIVTANTAPVAKAGPDRAVAQGAVVQLDGTASTDIDEQALTYSWTLKRPKGSHAVLANATTARPSFTTDLAGIYTATLTVSDDDVNRSDKVVIATGNLPPVAHAGQDRARLVAGQSIVLDGSQSVDPNGDALKYTWTITKRPSGSTAVLGSSSTPRATFTADRTGAYAFSLLVTDGFGAASTDTVLYSKEAPIADAGPDRYVMPGDAVVVDGSGSSHAIGTVAYGWALLSVPEGSSAEILNPADPQAEFMTDLPGTYVAQLVVFDGALFSADTVVVTASENAAPRVNLGADQVVSMPSIVTLDATGAADPDGGALTFSWALLSRPAGSAAALSSLNGSSTQLAGDVNGVYVVQLTATDSAGLAGVDTMVVSTLRGRPTVNAGADRTGATGTLIALSATASDPDGGPLAYEWRFLSRPANSSPALAGAATASPSFTPTVSGVYVAQVLVADSDQFLVNDAVVIRVSSDGPITPVVSITASDPAASEVGANPGTFTFTRTGDASSALAGVNWTRTGSATSGTDFTPPLPTSGSITFEPGESTTTLTITPASDSLNEGAELVTLTLVDGASYNLDQNSSATVSIADRPRDGGDLENGANHFGTIAAAQETHSWTFLATAGDAIALSIGRVTNANGYFNPWIRLRAPNGVELASGGSGAVGQINVVATMSGTYTVVVGSNDAYRVGTGTYQLTLAKTPGAFVVPDDDEGGPLTNGANHPGTIHLGDLDQWTFTAAANDSIALSIGRVTNANGYFNPWIRLRAPNGVELASEGSGTVGQINVVAKASGTYTVLVGSNDAYRVGTGTYRLTLAKTPGTFVVPDDDEGGPLTNGANHPGTIHLGDLDQWTFTAAANDSIALSIGRVTNANGSFNPWIRLRAPNGAELASGGSGAVGQINVVAATSGTYTVLVGSNDAYRVGTGTYRLTLAKTPGTFVVPDDDEGGPLTNGANHPGTIHLGDLDQWTFTAAANDSIALSIGRVTNANGYFNPWIRLRAPNGVELASEGSGTVGQINVVAKASGTYTVLVGSNDAYRVGTGTYRLTLAKTPGTFVVPDDDEGGPLTNGANHPGTIHLGDLDQWTFTVAVNDSIALSIGRVTNANGSFNPWIRLRAPNGAELASDSGAVGQINVVAATSGTYTVVVGSNDAYRVGSGTYQIGVTLGQ